jgi:hypothetical protein
MEGQFHMTNSKARGIVVKNFKIILKQWTATAPRMHSSHSKCRPMEYER